MHSRRTPDGLLMQYQEFTWTPDGVHPDSWLSVTSSLSLISDGSASDNSLSSMSSIRKAAKLALLGFFGRSVSHRQVTLLHEVSETMELSHV
jgi:hypothetical protein